MDDRNIGKTANISEEPRLSLSTGPVHSETACAVRAVAGVGPGLAPAQLQVWRTVLQFVTQVWINCRGQVDLYRNPCGAVFASLATRLQVVRPGRGGWSVV